MTVNDLLKVLTAAGLPHRADGDPETEITGFSSIYHYKAGTVSWLRKFSALEEVETAAERFACVITPMDGDTPDSFDCRIRAENPRDAFFTIVEALWGEAPETGISDRACVEPGAVIGCGTSVGAFTFISGQTVIGENCRIGSNVTIRGRVRIGNDCVIQSGAVIGEDGFAFIKDGETQKYVKHYGGVRIDNHVHVGAQTCVVRGTIDDTWLQDYVKIDNLCHIAHNVVIGKCSIIIAGAVLMGSVHVGDDSWVSTSVVRDQRHIGSKAVVGMGAVVAKDVPDGITVAGNPAKPFERKEKI